MMSSVGRGIVFRQIDRLFRDGTLGGLEDGQLLERYLARRDESAFEALVDAHGPMVLSLCRRMLRDPRDIEDAFQATFLVLVRKAPAIRDRGLLSNWLYGVAYRVARRARTQTLRRRSRETAVADLEVATGRETREAGEIAPVLDQELNRLPEKYRAPLVLCYLRGCTHDQAAAELRCPVGTVRSRLARGRDLLKQRLTRRGLAPTAAILGAGRVVPSRLFTATVPPALGSATVRAALGFGSSSTLHAGAAAASLLALSQGVLTTMKLAQLKWIGLTLLTTSLSAGGVVAVSFAAAQPPRTATSENSAAIVVPDPQEKADPQEKKAELPEKAQPQEKADPREKAEPQEKAQPRRKSTVMLGNLRSDRFEALEQKIDELLRRIDPKPTMTTVTKAAPSPGRPIEIEALQAAPVAATATQAAPVAATATQAAPVAATAREAGLTTATTTQTGPGAATATTSPTPVRDRLTRSVPDPDRFDLEWRRTSPRPTNPIAELEVQLKLALDEYDRTERLFQRHSISLSEREQVRGKVLVIAAQLEGLDEEYNDEMDRLKLGLRRKKAELEKARAQERVAQTVTARNQRLVQRKPGMISEEDMAKAEAEFGVASAMVGIAEAELAEVGLRIRQLQRRHDRIQQVNALAERARAAVPASPVNPVPPDAPR
jgi:RNA polymerase sigma factor (sigma-70 family)